MDERQWRELLTGLSKAVIESGDYDHELPAEVRESGWLGYPGASEAEIQAAEQRLQTALPPSYRAFLKVSNGWRRASHFVRELWPAERLAWYRDQDPEMVEIWSEEWDRPPGDVDPPRPGEMVAVLAVCDYDDAVMLLNPKLRGPDGEWEAWLFASWVPGAQAYGSFWHLMQHAFESFVEIQQSRPPRPKSTLDVAEDDLEGLLRVLRRGDTHMRSLALTALGALVAERAFEAVLRILQNRRGDIMLREQAALALAMVGGPRSVEPLIEVLRSSRPGLKAKLAAALINRLLPPLISRLMPEVKDIRSHLRETPDSFTRKMTARPLIGIRQALLSPGDQALPALRRTLKDPDAGVRADVVDILTWGAPQGELLQELYACAHDPEPHVRATLATSLFHVREGDEQALPLLIRLLGDSDVQVRLAAISGCAGWLHQSAQPHLLLALQKLATMEPDPIVREAAQQLLASTRHWGIGDTR